MSTETNIIATMILDWAVRTFGPVAKDPPERAARLVEESVEVAQCMGVSKDVLHAIIDRTYSRPVGEISQEIGGVMVCAYSISALNGIDPMAALYAECVRVTQRDPEHWRKKHAAKVADGTGDVSRVRKICDCDEPTPDLSGEIGDTCVTCFGSISKRREQ